MARAVWDDGGRLDGTPILGGRPCVVTPASVDRVEVAGSHHVLPLVAERVTRAGERCRWWELPAIDAAADSTVEPLEQTIELQVGGVEAPVPVPRRGLARRSRTALDEIQPTGDDGAGVAPDNDQASPWTSATETAEKMISGHAGFIDEVVGDRPPDDAVTWSRRSPLVLRDLDQVLTRWRRIHEINEPRYALIVKLAEQLDRLLPHLCANPRRRLSRARQRQPVARVQQVDSGCMRWLARQPGRSVVEKAGPRQEVLAVVRQESPDTLENRVLRDFMVRATRAAKSYLLEFRGVQHERVTRVYRFLRLLQRLLATSEIGRVRRLDRIPEPNYVLQFDQRYQKIWDAYLRLIRQEKLADDAWKWRQRIWSEICLFGVLTAVRPEGHRSPRGDLILHPEQVAGSFLDRQNPITSARWDEHTRIDVLAGQHQLDLYAGMQQDAAELNGCRHADLTLVVRTLQSGRIRRVIGVWTMLDFDIEPPARWPAPPHYETLDRFCGLLITPERDTPRLSRRWRHVTVPPADPQAGADGVRRAVEAAITGGLGQ